MILVSSRLYYCILLERERDFYWHFWSQLWLMSHLSCYWFCLRNSPPHNVRVCSEDADILIATHDWSRRAFLHKRTGFFRAFILAITETIYTSTHCSSSIEYLRGSFFVANVDIFMKYNFQILIFFLQRRLPFSKAKYTGEINRIAVNVHGIS